MALQAFCHRLVVASKFEAFLPRALSSLPTQVYPVYESLTSSNRLCIVGSLNHLRRRLADDGLDQLL